MRDVAGEIGGALGEYLLESPIGRGLGKKITKGWVAGLEKQFFAQEEERLNTSFLLLLASVETFLSSISFTWPYSEVSRKQRSANTKVETSLGCVKT